MTQLFKKCSLKGMANFFLAPENSANFINRSLPTSKITLGQGWSLTLTGAQNTYSIIYQDKDWICSLGYCSLYGSNSMASSLKQILSDFDEQKIPLIKQTLHGQYVLIIKKDNFLYILNDFIGARNIFYSPQLNSASSSFIMLEDIIGVQPEDLDYFKLLEFLAIKEVLYPCWLGSKTAIHKINWLLPYEYLKVDLNQSGLKIKSMEFTLDNEKSPDLKQQAHFLIEILENTIYKKELESELVASSLTGGRDTRLVTAIVIKKYLNSRYRTAFSTTSRNSLYDLRIAKKISKITGVPLDIYELKLPEHEQIFIEITESFTPTFNLTICPLILNAGKYKLGFGGAYGTEVFSPIYVRDLSEFMAGIKLRIKKSLIINDRFYEYVISAIIEQLQELKKHYHLKIYSEKDYIRLLQLFITARYSSFLIGAFNQFGYNLEPFGTFPVIELGLQISESNWGSKRSLRGDALIEKQALVSLSPEMARVLAYSSFRPVMPLTIESSPRFVLGFSIQLIDWVINKFNKAKNIKAIPVFSDVYYYSSGWHQYYYQRFLKYFKKT